MKILIVYSTLTGNTKMVAESIYDSMADYADIASVDKAPSPLEYDAVIIGFWVDKGHADNQMLNYMKSINNQKTAVFYTLGAYPDSAHAEEVFIDTKERLEKQNNLVLGHFRCQGKVDPKLLEKMKNLSVPHPHAMTEERKARIAEAAKHPNTEDLKQAQNFAKNILKQLGN